MFSFSPPCRHPFLRRRRTGESRRVRLRIVAHLCALHLCGSASLTVRRRPHQSEYPPRYYNTTEIACSCLLCSTVVDRPCESSLFSRRFGFGAWHRVSFATPSKCISRTWTAKVPAPRPPHCVEWVRERCMLEAKTRESSIVVGPYREFLLLADGVHDSKALAPLLNKFGQQGPYIDITRNSRQSRIT